MAQESLNLFSVTQHPSDSKSWIISREYFSRDSSIRPTMASTFELTTAEIIQLYEAVQRKLEEKVKVL